MAFQFRLKLTKEQEAQCARFAPRNARFAPRNARFAGCCRFVWNRALALKKEAWERERKSVSRFELDALLVQWKKEFPWLAEAPSQALQQVNKDLDQAFQNFFRRCKTGETPGYPRFKKKGLHDAFRFPQGIRLLPDISGRMGAVSLPKLGPLKFRHTREIQGTIQNATVSRQAGAWHISFSCKDVPISPRIERSGTVGIDRGIAAFAALSDGTLVKGPEPGRKSAHRLARLQRNLSRKERYSQNWKKTKAKIQRLHSHTARVRKDFLQKLSTEIVKNHAVVVVEELKVRNMTRSAKGTTEEPGTHVRTKSGLNRAILDQGW
ncbi:MAG: transposase, partial [Chloroflexota bacterium]